MRREGVEGMVKGGEFRFLLFGVRLVLGCFLFCLLGSFFLRSCVLRWDERRMRSSDIN